MCSCSLCPNVSVVFCSAIAHLVYTQLKDKPNLALHGIYVLGFVIEEDCCHIRKHGGLCYLFLMCTFCMAKVGSFYCHSYEFGGPP